MKIIQTMPHVFPEVRRRLTSWFDRNQRPLPWRVDYLPYRIWVSEVMLQQTRVNTVLPYYQRWMERFPDLESLAAAKEEEILKYWEGMGYYSRAGNLLKAARVILRDFGGVFPSDYRTVLKLPGIGPYTASAVMSIAFNQDYPVVDGNVERVFARFFNIPFPLGRKEARDFVSLTARELLPVGEARRFNQGLMELGALVCTPRSPGCPRCPLEDLCEGRRLGLVGQRPVPGERKRIASIEVAAGVLVRAGEIFIQKRPGSGLMPHLWEFPGGKLEPGESAPEALVRELREELGIDVRCDGKLTVVRHGYTSYRVTLHVYFCSLQGPDQAPVLRAAVDAKWVRPEALDDFAFPAADRKVISLLRKRLAGQKDNPDENA